MEKPPAHFRAICLLIFLTSEVQGDFVYTALSPKTIRPHSSYEIILSLERSDVPVTFEIRIWAENTTLAEKNVSLSPKASNLVQFSLLKVPAEVYNLTIHATGEENGKPKRISETVGLQVDSKIMTTLIQTDKTIYKPGEVVQFRAIFVDRFLKPVPAAGIFQIQILDAQRNVVKSWKSLEPRKKYGIIHEKFELSKEPNLGDWTIEVTPTGSEDKQSHSFSVQQYVLPKFKVDLKANPTFVTYNDSKFNLEISSMYTLGKPVKGKCSVTLQPLYYYEIWNNEVTKEKRSSKTKDIEGLTSIEFDLKTDIQIKPGDAREYGNEYKVLASCTEQVTGHVQNSSVTLRLYKYPYKISVAEQPNSYKPGFPLTMVFKVSTQDDMPITDAREDALKISHGFAYNVEDSIVTKPIPPTGLVSVTFNTSTNEMINVNGIEVTYKEHMQYISVPMKHTSPTKNYMQLTLETMSPKAGDNISITAKVSRPYQVLTYMIVARANVLKWDRVTFPDPNSLQTFQIHLPQNSPSELTLIVFTILAPKDDITVDSLKLNVKPEAGKKLGITLSNSTVEPGANISINCQGFPNSLIALRGIDQSVTLLNDDKDITESSLTVAQQSFGSGTSYYGSWGGSDGYQIFEQAGFHILTNGQIKKSEQHLYYRYGGGNRRRRPYKAYKSMSLKPSAYSRLAEPEMMMMSDESPGAANVMAKASFGSVNSNNGASAAPVIRVRKSFPETWIFLEEETVDGSLNISSTVPDTITSWLISGFQISTSEGIVVADSNPKLTVFRPFFISLNLPYSVIRGEVLALQVLVHNYMDSEVKAQILIDNSEGHLAFLDEDKANAGTKEVVVNASSVSALSFMITPTKVGTVMLKLKAVSSMAGDGLSQPLIVKPPGVKQSRNNAILLNLLSERNVSTNISAVFPADRVPDGDTFKISVVGDPLGGTIQNLDNLIQLPHGCGEQNMLNFVPDIVVMDYLNATGSLTPDLKEKITKFIEKGYQQELTYRRYDGSFSAFGNSDSQGSTWLTAFVARSFISAEKYMFIDEEVVTSALQFLALQQSETGYFVEEGYILDQSLKGSSSSNETSNKQALTAYVLLTFAEAAQSLKYTRVTNASILTSGINWLIKESTESKSKDPYAINLITYLLHIVNHAKKDDYFKRMEDLAKTDSTSNFKFWKSPPVKTNRRITDNIIFIPYYSPWESYVKPASVEMTAYALLTHVIREGKKVSGSVPIARWLMKQRNEAGGFLSTQDTVVGITALSKFAEVTRISNYEMAIQVTWGPDSASTYTFYIGKENITTLQEYFLPLSVRDVRLIATGAGTALAQLSWTYYTNNTRNSSAFSLDVDVEIKDKSRRLEMTICAAYIEGGQSNMAILEVNTPTGYSFDQEELLDIKSNTEIMRYESEDRDTRLNVYFYNFKSKKTCTKLTAHRVHLVAKHSPASVLVFDYYDTTRRAQKFYDPPVLDICHICKADDSCKMKNCV